MVDQNLTPEQIRKVYKIAAEVVRLYGDTYLPVFERIHEEVEKINQKQSMKTLALSVASANSDLERNEDNHTYCSTN